MKRNCSFLLQQKDPSSKEVAAAKTNLSTKRRSKLKLVAIEVKEMEERDSAVEEKREIDLG